MPLGQRIAHMTPEGRPRIREDSSSSPRRVLRELKTWQSSALLLDVEVFDDRDELVAPIAVPPR